MSDGCALTRVHVAPASSDRYSPPPGFASYSRYSRLGFAVVTAMLPLPIRSLGRPAVTRDQWSPPSVLLNTPPSRAPLMIVHGLRSPRQSTANRTSGFPG